MLAGRRVRATFFLLGPMVQAAPQLAAEIAAAGHEIGVHGWDHRYATVRGPRACHDDLARACDTIAAATGTRPPAVPPAVRGAQRQCPDRRPPPRAAAGPVEYLGTGVGPRGHAGIGAGDPGQHPGGRAERCCCTIPTATGPPVGKAAAALGALPWLLDECARRALRVGPLAEHAAGSAHAG